MVAVEVGRAARSSHQGRMDRVSAWGRRQPGAGDRLLRPQRSGGLSGRTNGDSRSWFTPRAGSKILVGQDTWRGAADPRPAASLRANVPSANGHRVHGPRPGIPGWTPPNAGGGPPVPGTDFGVGERLSSNGGSLSPIGGSFPPVGGSLPPIEVSLSPIEGSLPRYVGPFSPIGGRLPWYGGLNTRYGGVNPPYGGPDSPIGGRLPRIGGRVTRKRLPALARPRGDRTS